VRRLLVFDLQRITGQTREALDSKEEAMQEITTVGAAKAFIGRQCTMQTDAWPTPYRATLVGWSSDMQLWLIHSKQLEQEQDGHRGHDTEPGCGAPTDSEWGHWWCEASELTLTPTARIEGNELILQDN